MKINFPPFPNSKIEPFLITSPQTTHYNCIAWAYGDNTKWYWPDSTGLYFWPTDIPREEKIQNFVKLFESIGYEICKNDELENGYLKIAIYADSSGNPTHAARQLPSGFWTSKLGQNFDVIHSIFSMEDGPYGNATIFMRRGINLHNRG